MSTPSASPTKNQLAELSWVAEFGVARSTAQLDALVAHRWVSRDVLSGRYGARLTPLGQQVLDAHRSVAAKPAQPLDPFDAIPRGGW